MLSRTTTYDSRVACRPEGVSGPSHLGIGQEVREVVGQTDRVAPTADVEAGSPAFRCGGVVYLLTYAHELRTHEFDLNGRPRETRSGEACKRGGGGVLLSCVAVVV